MLWWGLASGLELIGTWLAHPIPGRRLRSENVGFDAEHMLERCRTFLLIALGEAVLTTGGAIIDSSRDGLSGMTLASGTLAMAGTTALWALGFGRSNRIITRHRETSNDPIHVSRHAVNAMMIMVAGVIALAVANQEVITRPLGATPVALGCLLIAGPLLFVCAQGWYLWLVSAVIPRAHLIGGGLLLLLGRVAFRLPPYLALLLVCSGLIALATYFNRSMPARAPEPAD